MINFKPFFRLLSLCAAFLFAFTIQAETTEEKALREDFNRSYQQIEELGESKDFTGLLREAEEVSSEWKAKNMEYYGELMLKICSNLRSNAYPLDSPEADIRGVAQKAIETFNPDSEDNISVKMHYWLLSNLQERYTYSKGELTDSEWTVKRKTEAERWMVVWDRMESAIDPDFSWDPKTISIIMVNGVPLTEEQLDRYSKKLQDNMSPESIEDPTLRAEYESVIKENNAKIKHRGEQLGLVDLKKQLTRSLIDYFSGTYSIEPHNDAELQEMLAKHVKEEEIRSAILAALEVEKGKVRMEP